MQSGRESPEVSQSEKCQLTHQQVKPENEITTTGEILNNDRDQAEIVLSKNQQKRLARLQKSLETRPERRKAEREKKKLKKRELARQRLENGEPIPEPRKYKLMAESSNKFRVVIDMDFEEYMTEDEMSKAAKQVGRIYAANRHCENPCQLYVTSLKGKVRDRFSITNSGYRNWDIHISEQDYIDLFSCDKLDKSDEEVGNVEGNIIYLSGDADESLPEVDDILSDESTIFVIGGLVDHNRHKDLCRNRAMKRNIKTARLPVREHIKLSQRHIFSTFTVFDILLNVLGSRKQWVDAFVASIPKRKIASNEPSSNAAQDINEAGAKHKLNTSEDQT